MDKKHLTALISTIILLIGTGVVAELFYAKTLSLENELITLNQQTTDLGAQVERILSLRQNANSTDESTSLDTYFVDSKGALGFVKYVEDLAVSSGLISKVEVFVEQSDSELEKSGAEYLRTAVKTTGSLKNSRTFLSLIESLPYNVKIERVDLRRFGAITTKDEWTLTVDFSVVKKKEIVQ